MQQILRMLKKRGGAALQQAVQLQTGQRNVRHLVGVVEQQLREGSDIDCHAAQRSSNTSQGAALLVLPSSHPQPTSKTAAQSSAGSSARKPPPAIAEARSSKQNAQQLQQSTPLKALPRQQQQQQQPPIMLQQQQQHQAVVQQRRSSLDRRPDACKGAQGSSGIAPSGTVRQGAGSSTGSSSSRRVAKQARPATQRNAHEMFTVWTSSSFYAAM